MTQETRARTILLHREVIERRGDPSACGADARLNFLMAVFDDSIWKDCLPLSRGLRWMRVATHRVRWLRIRQGEDFMRG